MLTLRKFYYCQYTLVNRNGISVSQMFVDMFGLSESQSGPFLIHDISQGFVTRVARLSKATSGAGTSYPSGAPEFSTAFSVVRIARSLVL